MSNASQRRAVRNYRRGLTQRGMARFEVVGLVRDRSLIRSLARRLAENGTDATRLRSLVTRTIAGEQKRKGGILAALRRSPLVGAELSITRQHTRGRNVAV